MSTTPPSEKRDCVHGKRWCERCGWVAGYPKEWLEDGSRTPTVEAPGGGAAGLDAEFAALVGDHEAVALAEDAYAVIQADIWAWRRGIIGDLILAHRLRRSLAAQTPGVPTAPAPETEGARTAAQERADVVAWLEVEMRLPRDKPRGEYLRLCIRRGHHVGASADHIPSTPTQEQPGTEGEGGGDGR